MTAATHTGQVSENYQYDSNGNRTNTGTSTGTNNRLLADDKYDYQYDAEGNRTRRTDRATGQYQILAWDHRNRLTSVTTFSATGTKLAGDQYTYDLFDRRIARKIDADGNGVFETTQRFVYDGEDLILAFSGSTNTLTNRYLYGPATDEILADEKITTGTASTAGTVTWSLGDNLGTIRDLVQYNATTGTTTVVNHVRYDTFGQIVSQTNSQFQPWFAYTGREWDPAAGLYFYRARWYDPRAGRFLSEDPIGFAAGDVNLSRYVGNGATLWVDPSGMAGQLYTTSYQQMMTEMQSFAVRCAGGGLIDPNAPAGYSNPFTRWLGENLVRGVIEDTRLAKQGGVADDVLLSTLVVTHYTQQFDPTPASGMINAGSRIIDGDHDAVQDLVLSSLAMGGGLQRASQMARSGQVVKRGLGGLPSIGRLGANPHGCPGGPDHRDAVRKLAAIIKLLFPPDSGQYEIFEGKSIKQYKNGVNRNPDVFVVDTLLDKVVCVGEAARENADGTLVKRERNKAIDYINAGLDIIHVRIPKKKRK